jgi:hypothetical protein
LIQIKRSGRLACFFLIASFRAVGTWLKARYGEMAVDRLLKFSLKVLDPNKISRTFPCMQDMEISCYRCPI